MFNVPPIPPHGPPNGTIPGNTSTWGGAALYDPMHKLWFMWATELKGISGGPNRRQCIPSVPFSGQDIGGNIHKDDITIHGVWGEQAATKTASTVRLQARLWAL